MGIKYKDANENCSKIHNEIAITEVIVDGWMKSEGHRENILEAKWKKVGVGIIDKDDIRICTAIFTY